MTLVTLTRQEWKAIAEELDVAYGDDSPPGLRERIAALLAATPAAWPDQACNLELADLTAVDLVESIVRQRKKAACTSRIPVARAIVHRRGRADHPRPSAPD